MNTVYKTRAAAIKAGWRTVEMMQESGIPVRRFLHPLGFLRYRTDDGDVTFLVRIKNETDDRGRPGAAVPMFLPGLATDRKCFPTLPAACAYVEATGQRDLRPEKYMAYNVADGREVTVWVLYDKQGRCLHRDGGLRFR